MKQRDELIEALIECGTDFDGAMKRFAGDESLYISCLEDFLHDQTVRKLDDAIKTSLWDDAFTAAHALKGLAGNMGFVPLFHITGEMVIYIRNGRMEEIVASNEKVKQCYEDIVEAIGKI